MRDDLISRQIIKAQMMKYGFRALDMTVTEFVEDCLPSAQQDCSDCIKRGGDWDCDHVHCHKGESAQPGFNEWCTDCKEYDQERHCCPRYNRVIREALDAVEKPKMGKWIETDDGWDGTYYVCSICGCPWTLIDGDPEDNGMNYCPHCGADMRTSE